MSFNSLSVWALSLTGSSHSRNQSRLGSLLGVLSAQALGRKDLFDDGLVINLKIDYF